MNKLSTCRASVEVVYWGLNRCALWKAAFELEYAGQLDIVLHSRPSLAPKAEVENKEAHRVQNYQNVAFD